MKPSKILLQAADGVHKRHRYACFEVAHVINKTGSHREDADKARETLSLFKPPFLYDLDPWFPSPWSKRLSKEEKEKAKEERVLMLCFASAVAEYEEQDEEIANYPAVSDLIRKHPHRKEEIILEIRRVIDSGTPTNLLQAIRISQAFYFGETPQGFEYWWDLD